MTQFAQGRVQHDEQALRRRTHYGQGEGPQRRTPDGGWRKAQCAQGSVSGSDQLFRYWTHYGQGEASQRRTPVGVGGGCSSPRVVFSTSNQPPGTGRTTPKVRRRNGKRGIGAWRKTQFGQRLRRQRSARWQLRCKGKRPVPKSTIKGKRSAPLEPAVKPTIMVSDQTKLSPTRCNYSDPGSIAFPVSGRREFHGRDWSGRSGFHSVFPLRPYTPSALSRHPLRWWIWEGRSYLLSTPEQDIL